MTELGKKWIEALRSGEYKQTKGCLQDHKGYCCMGVAWEVYSKETGLQTERVESTPKGQIYFGELQSGMGITKEIADAFGLPFGNRGNLARLNDDMNYSFDEIADYLEKVLL